MDMSKGHNPWGVVYGIVNLKALYGRWQVARDLGAIAVCKRTYEYLYNFLKKTGDF